MHGWIVLDKPLGLSSAQAVAAVKALRARGVRSIDVGCLQVNLMYHPDAFATIEDAFDPRMNAAYATRFLNALYADGRDWAHAIAAYHSETPALGDAYRVLVMARWQNGDVRVMDAYCPHLGADIGVGGRVEGNCLVCPFHGWGCDGSWRNI